jgi:hypothetical protein
MTWWRERFLSGEKAAQAQEFQEQMAMRRLWFKRAAFTIGLFLVGMSQACAFELIPQVGASWAVQNPSVRGGEGSVSLLTTPIPDRWAHAGLRLAYLKVSDGGANQREELSPGVEGVVWMMNEIGDGLVVEWADMKRYRVEPYLGLRVWRIRRVGAIALRFGVPYDERFQWGVKAGISLQFSGVNE